MESTNTEYAQEPGVHYSVLQSILRGASFPFSYVFNECSIMSTKSDPFFGCINYAPRLRCIRASSVSCKSELCGCIVLKVEGWVFGFDAFED